MSTALPELPQHGIRQATVAGCELRYLRIGTGRPVILLHTLRTQLEYYLSLIDRLDTSRYEVIAVDLPGHGHSAAPRVDYTAGYFTEVAEGLLEACDVSEAIAVGDSIGATIALSLAARANPRIAHVVAVNPYDYGRWGGIRRSSALADVLFTAMQWPVAGPVVARSGTRGVLRRVLEGGLHDASALPAALVDELHRCGSLPGHARAFRSLNRQWRTWIAARQHSPAIGAPVSVVTGCAAWPRAGERAANSHAIATARTVPVDRCGHFASLERPETIAEIIGEIA